MSIRVHLPDHLRYSIARGRGVFEVDGETVSECLDQVASLLPGIKKALFYDPDKKALHSYVKVLLNQRRVKTEELVAKVQNGDEIDITMRRN